MNKTLIYYTANQEDPKFEQKIIDNLKKQAGDIPIISVSRKPIDLGKNICVGEKPICYSNSFKQLLIGLEEAKTDFCISAESDCLYPPEYFMFTPPLKDQVYRYSNVYVYFDRHVGLWMKKFTEAGQMCGRKHWIKSIKKVLKGHKGWEPIPNKELPQIFDTENQFSWHGRNPILYFKTRKGIGFKTGFLPGSTLNIPYWGTYFQIKERYLR